LEIVDTQEDGTVHLHRCDQETDLSGPFKRVQVLAGRDADARVSCLKCLRYATPYHAALAVERLTTPARLVSMRALKDLARQSAADSLHAL
jgi:hypothetical protein